MQDSSVGKTLEGDLDENGFTLFLRIPDQSGSNVPGHNLVPSNKTGKPLLGWCRAAAM